jgi:hypothetical protein
MPNLTRYTLTYDERRNRWTLGNDRTNRVVKSFETKKDATRGGVLRNAHLSSRPGSSSLTRLAMKKDSGWLSASARFLRLSPFPAGGRRRPRTPYSPGCVPTHFAGGDRLNLYTVVPSYRMRSAVP